jgi:hypothetical protein
MNALIAELIRGRIEAMSFAFTEKIGGLAKVRIETKAGQVRKYPVVCDVTAPADCDVKTESDMIPSAKLKSLMFFEADSFPTYTKDRAPGKLFEVRLRLVVWINCAFFGGDCNCGDTAAQQLIGAIDSHHYNEGDFREIQHIVTGGGTVRGPEVFSRYTFNEAETQYLSHPFDAFSIDILTKLRVMPGCEPTLTLDPQAC